MNNQAAEMWDAYTDTEKVSWVCEAIMKKEVVSECEDLRRCGLGNMAPRYAIYDGSIVFRSSDSTIRSWDPLNNVSDAMEAECTLTDASKEIQKKYAEALTFLLQIEDEILTADVIWKLIQASGNVRCTSMFIALYPEN